MPLTPLHLGIATCCKAVANHRFSFLIFAGTQVFMDLEPLFGILLKWQTLHLYTHNLIGALLIGLISTFLGKPISEWVLKRFHYTHWQISWQCALISAFLGSFSHVFLDAMMHADMFPFFPFSLDNPFLGLVSYASIFYFCIISFTLGALISLLRLTLLSSKN